MSRSHALLLLSVSVVLGAGFAGCVGGAASEEDTAAFGGDADALFGSGALATPPRIHLPSWHVGQTWTYRVDGDWVGVPYVVDVGVVAVEGGRYVMGVDREEEVRLDVVHGGLFHGGIRVDSLAVSWEGRWQDLVGVTREHGESWPVLFAGRSLTMTAHMVRDVLGPDGIESGVRVTGSGGGARLLVEYGSTSEGLTRFEWREDDVVLLRYDLLGVGERDPAQLFTWRVGPATTVTASGISLVRTVEWQSSGKADLVVLQGSADLARAGRATVWDPSVRPALTVSARADQAVDLAVAVQDQAGTWRLVATSLGSPVSLSVRAVWLDPAGIVEPEPQTAPKQQKGLIGGTLDRVDILDVL